MSCQTYLLTNLCLCHRKELCDEQCLMVGGQSMTADRWCATKLVESGVGYVFSTGNWISVTVLGSVWLTFSPRAVNLTDGADTTVPVGLNPFHDRRVGLAMVVKGP